MAETQKLLRTGVWEDRVHHTPNIFVMHIASDLRYMLPFYKYTGSYVHSFSYGTCDEECNSFRDNRDSAPMDLHPCHTEFDLTEWEFSAYQE